jgi:hypothetical protein
LLFRVVVRYSNDLSGSVRLSHSALVETKRFPLPTPTTIRLPIALGNYLGLLQCHRAAF